MIAYKCRKCGSVLNNYDLARLQAEFGDEIPLDKYYHEWCTPKEDDEVQEEASNN